jgi:hypothetical protein
MTRMVKRRGGRYTPPRGRICFLCGEVVDQVEELPAGLEVSGPAHRECAEELVKMMRAECSICQGVDHRH